MVSVFAEADILATEPGRLQPPGG